jgi:hypothetical protein
VSRGTQDPDRRLHLFAYWAITFCGRPFQNRSAKISFITPICRSYNLHDPKVGIWAFLPAVPNGKAWQMNPLSLAATQGIISFPPGTKMFQFPGFPLHQKRSILTFVRTGFPIRTSSDQKLIGTYPRLIAAFHVLHRSTPPRHPLSALIRLLNKH